MLYVADPASKEEIRFHLDELVLSTEGKRDLTKEQATVMLDNIFNKRNTNARPLHRTAFLYRWRWAAAAAIILVIGAAAYFWTISKKAEQTLTIGDKHLQPTIMPGINKATLTVDDKVIDLASHKTSITVGDVISYSDGEKLSDAGKMLQLTTPKGGQYQIVLPDGTKVWLNAASSVRFPTAFGKDRRVEVAGEAYLEVAPNKKKPFHVSANGMGITVLGTSFNVNAYTDEPVVQATLLEGKINVSKGNQTLMLAPGQQAVVNQGIQLHTNVNTSQVIAWKNGAFDLNNKNLPEIMRQVARWYNIDVHYEGPVPEKRLEGKMGRDLSLQQCLKLLETMNIRFRLEGRNLTVLP